MLSELLNKIKAARLQAIKILREQPMSATQIISRSSKSIKDPSPIVTTMMHITTKYPLRISKDLADKHQIPKKFLYKNGLHNHGHILCKKEAIE